MSQFFSHSSVRYSIPSLHHRLFLLKLNMKSQASWYKWNAILSFLSLSVTLSSPLDHIPLFVMLNGSYWTDAFLQFGCALTALAKAQWRFEFCLLSSMCCCVSGIAIIMLSFWCVI